MSRVLIDASAPAKMAAPVSNPDVLIDLFDVLRGEPPARRATLDPENVSAGKYWTMRARS